MIALAGRVLLWPPLRYWGKLGARMEGKLDCTGSWALVALRLKPAGSFGGPVGPRHNYRAEVARKASVTP